MKFERYQHVEQLGRDEVKGILNGNVYIFSKLDGANISVYLNDDGKVEVASRNRVITPEDDLRGVWHYVNANHKFKDFFGANPNLRLFGEWLVPHTFRNYKDDAWKKLYIFDVIDNGEYVKYENYAALLDKYQIEYIPLIVKLEDPTEEQVKFYLDNCTFLTSGGAGEGIVIKNYDFVNQFGRTTWAKLVRHVAKAAMKLKLPISADSVEQQIVDAFLTPELVEKEFAQIVSDNGGSWDKKFIAKLLGCTWHTFIVEETFHFVKKFRNPKVDFAVLNQLVVAKVKEFKADLFA